MEINRQTDRVYSLSLSEFPNTDLFVVSFSCEEHISQLYEARLVVAVESFGIDMSRVLSSVATLRITAPNQKRTFHGIVTEAITSTSFLGYTAFEITIHPRHWLLCQSFNTRVFQDVDMEGLFDAVLQGTFSKNTDYRIELTRKYRRHDYVCQYNESDYQFLMRWMEKQGIYFFFRQEEGQECMVITDHFSQQPDLKPESIPYNNGQTRAPMVDEIGDPCIHHIRNRLSRSPGKVIVKDYNYERPTLDLRREAYTDPTEKDDVAQREGCEYHYGNGEITPEETEFQAKLRAEMLACRRARYEGDSTAPQLSAGWNLSLTDHPFDEFNAKYMVLSVTHEGAQLPPYADQAPSFFGQFKTVPLYENRFSALLEGVQFRTERETPWPFIRGMLNAIIDTEGSDNKPIVDKLGRYKVRLPFDSAGHEKKEGKASRWLRMATPYGGENFGFNFPLHKGTEVLLGFENGDPDRPFIASAMQNPQVAGNLRSDNQQKSGFSTGGGNTLGINDEDGHQHFELKTGDKKSFLRIGSGSGNRMHGAADSWTNQFGDGFQIAASGASMALGTLSHSMIAGGLLIAKLASKILLGELKEHGEFNAVEKTDDKFKNWLTHQKEPPAGHYSKEEAEKKADEAQRAFYDKLKEHFLTNCHLPDENRKFPKPALTTYTSAHGAHAKSVCTKCDAIYELSGCTGCTPTAIVQINQLFHSCLAASKGKAKANAIDLSGLFYSGAESTGYAAGNSDSQTLAKEEIIKLSPTYWESQTLSKEDQKKRDEKEGKAEESSPWGSPPPELLEPAQQAIDELVESAFDFVETMILNKIVRTWANNSLAGGVASAALDSELAADAGTEAVTESFFMTKLVSIFGMMKMWRTEKAAEKEAGSGLSKLAKSLILPSSEDGQAGIKITRSSIRSESKITVDRMGNSIKLQTDSGKINLFAPGISLSGTPSYGLTPSTLNILPCNFSLSYTSLAGAGAANTQAHLAVNDQMTKTITTAFNADKFFSVYSNSVVLTASSDILADVPEEVEDADFTFNQPEGVGDAPVGLILAGVQEAKPTPSPATAMLYGNASMMSIQNTANILMLGQNSQDEDCTFTYTMHMAENGFFLKAMQTPAGDPYSGVRLIPENATVYGPTLNLKGGETNILGDTALNMQGTTVSIVGSGSINIGGEGSAKFGSTEITSLPGIKLLEGGAQVMLGMGEAVPPIPKLTPDPPIFWEPVPTKIVPTPPPSEGELATAADAEASDAANVAAKGKEVEEAEKNLKKAEQTEKEAGNAENKAHEAEHAEKEATAKENEANRLTEEAKKGHNDSEAARAKMRFASQKQQEAAQARQKATEARAAADKAANAKGNAAKARGDLEKAKAQNLRAKKELQNTQRLHNAMKRSAAASKRANAAKALANKRKKP